MDLKVQYDKLLRYCYNNSLKIAPGSVNDEPWIPIMW